MMMKGQKINDRYQIIKTIGEGGMANVYLAYDEILDRNVALKILRGDLAGDEKFVRRFQREALSSSSLSHPNIVEMYDVGEDDGQYYIVMEYIDGKTIKQLIKKRGGLTLSEVVDIMLQLTDGISHAHDSFIIHRDIKPQNIMILENGLVKITDFGIAMAINAAQLTQTNSVMGSVHYLPPEQAVGKGATIKSDIYSLGILMFELVTGRIPFKGENAVEIALKQMKEPLPDVTQINPEIPMSIENILLKACAKNPKNRYKDTKAMYEDLKNCLSKEAKDQKRVVYKYPENDLESTKVLEKLDESNILDDEIIDVNDEVVAKKLKNDKKTNKNKKIPWIVLSIIVGILFIGLAIFLIWSESDKDIKILDVKGMSIVEAEEKLRNAGLKVKLETKEVASDSVSEGLVVKTEPNIGRVVPEDTTITLYVSLGSSYIEVKDYTGEDCKVIKALIENDEELEVKCELKTVDDVTKYKEGVVFDQNPKGGEGTKLPKGATLTLYIPNFNLYPNMVIEPWTEEEVVAFAEEHSLTLEIDYIESSNENVGYVIWQSRRAGTVISKDTTFKVNISIEKPEVIPPVDNGDDNTDSNDDDTNSGDDTTGDDNSTNDNNTNTDDDTTNDNGTDTTNE